MFDEMLRGASKVNISLSRRKSNTGKKVVGICFPSDDGGIISTFMETEIAREIVTRDKTTKLIKSNLLA